MQCDTYRRLGVSPTQNSFRFVWFVCSFVRASARSGCKVEIGPNSGSVHFPSPFPPTRCSLFPFHPPGFPFSLRGNDHPSETKCEAKCDQVKPGETNWNQVKPSETKWNWVRPSETKGDPMRPRETKQQDQAKPSETKWNRVNPSDTNQVSANETNWSQWDKVSESKWVKWDQWDSPPPPQILLSNFSWPYLYI